MVAEPRLALPPGRLLAAFAASLALHGFLMAGAPFAPGPRALSAWRQTVPLEARLLTAAEPKDAAADASTPDTRSNTEPQAAGQTTTPSPAATGEDRASSGLPSPETFFRSSELDERAEALNIARLVYPEEALKARIAGRVVVRLWIDRRGTLADAAVVSADPPGVFEAAALEAVRTLEFRPARRHGAAVGSIKTIEVPFHPNCSDNGNCLD